MKDKFIAITSHELRTPVSHLKGYLDILSDEGNYPVNGRKERVYANCEECGFMGGGLGLGLSTAPLIAAAHGGAPK